MQCTFLLGVIQKNFTSVTLFFFHFATLLDAVIHIFLVKKKSKKYAFCNFGDTLIQKKGKCWSKKNIKNDKNLNQKNWSKGKMSKYKKNHWNSLKLINNRTQGEKRQIPPKVANFVKILPKMEKKCKQKKANKQKDAKNSPLPPCIPLPASRNTDFFFILFIKKEQKHIFAGEINKKASIV